MSFFTSGKVNTRVINRKRLTVLGTYRVRIADMADHLKTNSGDRTQFEFVVVAGPSCVGERLSELVYHKQPKQWMEEKNRGNIAIIVGAFLGLSAEKSGFEIPKNDGKKFHENTRVITYVNAGADVGEISRDASDLPLVQAGAEAFLIVTPNIDRATGKQKITEKTGLPSVIYNFYPLSAGLTPTTETEAFVDDGDEASAAPATSAPEVDAPEVDALEKAAAAGWRPNPNAPGYFYAKGEPKQLKEADLRAKFA